MNDCPGTVAFKCPAKNEAHPKTATNCSMPLKIWQVIFSLTGETVLANRNKVLSLKEQLKNIKWYLSL